MRLGIITAQHYPQTEYPQNQSHSEETNPRSNDHVSLWAALPLLHVFPTLGSKTQWAAYVPVPKGRHPNYTSCVSHKSAAYVECSLESLLKFHDAAFCVFLTELKSELQSLLYMEFSEGMGKNFRRHRFFGFWISILDMALYSLLILRLFLDIVLLFGIMADLTTDISVGTLNQALEIKCVIFTGKTCENPKTLSLSMKNNWYNKEISRVIFLSYGLSCRWSDDYMARKCPYEVLSNIVMAKMMKVCFHGGSSQVQAVQGHNLDRRCWSQAKNTFH